MKKFIKRITAAITLLSVLCSSVLTAWGEEIQLTDYRYESGQILKHDYVLLDYEVPLPDSSYPMDERQIWNVPGSGEIYYNYICWQGECLEKENQRTKRPVSLLSPDGIVAFKPGKYVMYYYYQYITHSRGEYGASVRIDPQGVGGEYYAAYDIDAHKSGILDKGGNIAVDFIYTSIQPFDKLFLAYDAGETTYFKHYYVINPENGKVLFKYLNSNDELALNRSFYYYISEDGNYFAVYGFSSPYAVYMFCDLDGNIIDSSNNASMDECEEKFLLGEISYHHSETIQDKDGRVYNRIIVGAHDENTVEKNNLRLRTKEIGGKTYYAVFRELEEGENEADYRTYDESSTWAENSVNSLKSEGLLYNESACRYTDNISRLDFAALSAEVFCKAKGFNIEDYIVENNITIDYDTFTDTENAYVILACQLGIMEETAETTFSPARGISYDEAVTMLNSLAGLLGVNINFTTADFTETDRPALSREQAYVCLCRIYEAAVSQ